MAPLINRHDYRSPPPLPRMGLSLLMGGGGSLGAFPVHYSHALLPPRQRWSEEGGRNLLYEGGPDPRLVLYLL